MHWYVHWAQAPGNQIPASPLQGPCWVSVHSLCSGFPPGGPVTSSDQVIVGTQPILPCPYRGSRTSAGLLAASHAFAGTDHVRGERPQVPTTARPVWISPAALHVNRPCTRLPPPFASGVNIVRLSSIVDTSLGCWSMLRQPTCSTRIRPSFCWEKQWSALNHHQRFAARVLFPCPSLRRLRDRVAHGNVRLRLPRRTRVRSGGAKSDDLPAKTSTEAAFSFQRPPLFWRPKPNI